MIKDQCKVTMNIKKVYVESGVAPPLKNKGVEIVVWEDFRSGYKDLTGKNRYFLLEDGEQIDGMDAPSGNLNDDVRQLIRRHNPVWIEALDYDRNPFQTTPSQIPIYIKSSKAPIPSESVNLCIIRDIFKFKTGDNLFCKIKLRPTSTNKKETWVGGVMECSKWDKDFDPDDYDEPPIIDDIYTVRGFVGRSNFRGFTEKTRHHTTRGIGFTAQLVGDTFSGQTPEMMGNDIFWISITAANDQTCVVKQRSEEPHTYAIWCGSKNKKGIRKDPS